jgi:hypothetical protein|tara:strand:+ start:124 stop:294 length:171 start_codon:yes stop_codon:yes gene_type:complete
MIVETTEKYFIYEGEPPLFSYVDVYDSDENFEEENIVMEWKFLEDDLEFALNIEIL